MIADKEDNALWLKMVADKSKKERRRTMHLEFMERKEELEEVLEATKLSAKVKSTRLQELSGTESEGSDDV